MGSVIAEAKKNLTHMVPATKRRRNRAFPNRELNLYFNQSSKNELVTFWTLAQYFLCPPDAEYSGTGASAPEDFVC